MNERFGIKEPLYAYRFDAEIPGWDHPGTFHSVDLWFFFETLAKCWRPFTGKHYDLARQMCDYWCNFIKNGDPNGQDSQEQRLPLWKPLNDREAQWMIFAEEAVPQQRKPSELEDFLINHMLK